MPLLSFFIALSACIVLVFAESFSTDPFDEQPALHLPIYRRGGSFETFDPGNETASLTGLAAELIKTRQRYDLTHRVINGNKLVRKAKRSEDVGKDNDVLMSEVEVDGRWY